MQKKLPEMQRVKRFFEMQTFASREGLLHVGHLFFACRPPRSQKKNWNSRRRSRMSATPEGKKNPRMLYYKFSIFKQIRSVFATPGDFPESRPPPLFFSPNFASPRPFLTCRPHQVQPELLHLGKFCFACWPPFCMSGTRIPLGVMG